MIDGKEQELNGKRRLIDIYIENNSSGIDNSMVSNMTFKNIEVFGPITHTNNLDARKGTIENLVFENVVINGVKLTDNITGDIKYSGKVEGIEYK